MNKIRGLVHAVFESSSDVACHQPRSKHRRRRERQRDALETYTVDEVKRLAEAMAEGAHCASGARSDAGAAGVRAAYRFRDGLIMHLRVYGDRTEALADLGLAPEGGS